MKKMNMATGSGGGVPERQKKQPYKPATMPSKKKK